MSGLEEWMDYQVQMVAYNAIGDSRPSATESERTEESGENSSSNLFTECLYKYPSKNMHNLLLLLFFRKLKILSVCLCVY